MEIIKTSYGPVFKTVVNTSCTNLSVIFSQHLCLSTLVREEVNFPFIIFMFSVTRFTKTVTSSFDHLWALPIVVSITSTSRLLSSKHAHNECDNECEQLFNSETNKAQCMKKYLKRNYLQIFVFPGSSVSTVNRKQLKGSNRCSKLTFPPSSKEDFRFRPRNS